MRTRKPKGPQAQSHLASQNARPAAQRPGGRSSPSKPTKAAFRLLVEYEGSRYHGWQRQGEAQQAAGVRTVADTLERVLREAGLRVLTLGGSGRTDAGVHALGQVAHLHLPQDQAPSLSELQWLFDQGLPTDLAMRSIEACSPTFHARHDALSRSYLYQVSLRRTALAKPFVWWVKARLDPALLQEAWHAFTGFHDMGAFADLEGEDPRCEIRTCEFVREGDLLVLRTTASHFLRKQVRRMVGAAVACATGKARLQDLLRDLERPDSGAPLRWSGLAAPSAGLFLEHVQYEGEPGPGPLRGILRVG